MSKKTIIKQREEHRSKLRAIDDATTEFKDTFIKYQDEKDKLSGGEDEATGQTDIQKILANSNENLENTNQILNILENKFSNSSSITSLEFNNPISKDNRDMKNIPEIQELQSFVNNTFIASNYFTTIINEVEPYYTEYINKETGAIIDHFPADTNDPNDNTDTFYYNTLYKNSFIQINASMLINVKDNLIQDITFGYNNDTPENTSNIFIYDNNGDGKVDYMQTNDENSNTSIDEGWEENDDGQIVYTKTGRENGVEIRGKKNSNKNNQAINLHRIIHSLQKRLHKKQR